MTRIFVEDFSLLSFQDMRNSLGTMETVMQATTKSLQSQLLKGAGDLAHALAEFDESLIMEPAHFKEVQVPRIVFRCPNLWRISSSTRML